MPSATPPLFPAVRRSPTQEYKSRFAEWDTKAWVRSKSHHVVPFEPRLYFFSESIAPLFTHPEVREAREDVRRELLVLHLYRWLEFTEWLELGPVNDACNMIRRPDFLPWLPGNMKADAIKIYTDEAGHAEMSRALVDATEEYTGIPRNSVTPAFVSTLDRMTRELELEFAPLVILLFALVSETLITGSLTQLPKDQSVQQAVRDLASDHASDEGRHHAFFRWVCIYLWPRLPVELRRVLGPLFPEMILAFLSPNPTAMEGMLKLFPDVFPMPRRIAEEVSGSAEMKAAVRTAAAPTLRILRDNEVLADPETYEAFVLQGLVDPE